VTAAGRDMPQPASNGSARTAARKHSTHQRNRSGGQAHPLRTRPCGDSVVRSRPPDAWRAETESERSVSRNRRCGCRS